MFFSYFAFHLIVIFSHICLISPKFFIIIRLMLQQNMQCKISESNMQINVVIYLKVAFILNMMEEIHCYGEDRHVTVETLSSLFFVFFTLI